MTRLLNAADVILAKGRQPQMRGRTALIHSAGTMTYGELVDHVERTAAALVQLGMTRGDRVAMLMKDSPLSCAVFLGALHAGGVPIPVNTRIAPDDLAFIVGDSGARLLIAHEEFMDSTRPFANGGPTEVVEAGALARAIAAVGGGSQSTPTRADEPAFWLYSSGTTGKPKAILHSHANAAQAGKLLREVVGANEETVVLATSKLFFAFALDNAFTGPLLCGATTILNEDWPDPEQIAAQAARYRPTVLFTVPTFFRRLLALGADRLTPFGKIPYNMTGGERLPDAIFHQWREMVGTELLVGYGMSETFCQAFSNFPGENRLGSCGVPLGGVLAKVLDEAGNEVPIGEPGVLWLRHPSLATCYRSPSATAEAFCDGWFRTNDLFTRDADGYGYHQGRADELCKVAGLWVKPADVEEAVLTHERFREAACVVVRDADGFDRLAVFVVPVGEAQGAEQAARDRCAARLPRHSQPKWVCIVDDLPRTASGKVQRFLLRQKLAEELAGATPNRAAGPHHS